MGARERRKEKECVCVGGRYRDRQRETEIERKTERDTQREKTFEATNRTNFIKS